MCRLPHTAHCIVNTSMAAYVASSPLKDEYTTSFAVPKIGDLHQQYADLPSPCEVLLEVYSSSVSPSDIRPNIAAYPHVLGSDVCGKVVEVGSGCKRLKVGDEVWGDIGANAITVKGQKTKELGGYAQYALALESQLGFKPKDMDVLEVGSLPKVALTSYKALVWYAGAKNTTLWKLSPTVVILGGSGGTGTVGIQLAKAFGAGKVITTTSADNFDYCKSLGADELIDYKTDNWWDVLKSDSVDVIYDTVGQAGTGDRAMDKIRSGGHYVTITGALASKVKPGVTQSMFINSDTNLDNVPQVDDLTSLMEAGYCKMPKLTVFGLDQVEDAFKASQSGTTVGKNVISVAKPSSS